MAGHSSTIPSKPAAGAPGPDCHVYEPPEFGEAAPAAPAVGPSSLIGQQLATDVYFQGTFGGGAVVRRFIKRLALPPSWPMPPGNVIALQLPPDGRLVRLLVDFCGQLGGRWVLFCTFLDIRPADVERYFGPDGPSV